MMIWVWLEVNDLMILVMCLMHYIIVDVFVVVHQLGHKFIVFKDVCLLVMVQQVVKVDRTF